MSDLDNNSVMSETSHRNRLSRWADFNQNIHNDLYITGGGSGVMYILNASLSSTYFIYLFLILFSYIEFYCVTFVSWQIFRIFKPTTSHWNDQDAI